MVTVVILSVAVLGATATATFAGRRLREAHAIERAVAGAALVLDSLVLLDSIRPGERVVNRYRFRWTTLEQAGTTLVELVVEYHDGTAVRRLRLGTRHLPLPPRLGGAT